MENRTTLKTDTTTNIYYEAVITKKNRKSFRFTITKDTLEQLQNAIDIWLCDGLHELVTAEKVERVMTKIVA